MLINKDFKRLGDLAAGTLVVHKRKVKSEKFSIDADGLAAKVPLTLAEQSAIISFAERSNKMSEGRTAELAGYLGPWLEHASDNKSDKKNTKNDALTLKRMAKWLRGHR